MSKNSEILVVEGSRTQAERLRLALQAHGYQVTVATDGAEAITVAHQRRPALILSGIAMPGMDGYAMCAALKQDAALQDIPVVLLTALANAEDLLRGLAAQVDYCIAKPYQEDDLLARIAVLLANPLRYTGAPGQEKLVAATNGKLQEITADRCQLLRLLFSTYENYQSVLRQNRELTKAQVQAQIQYQQLKKESEQRKHENERVHATAERYRALLEQSAEAMLVVDREGIVRAANTAAAALVGRSVEELVGKECGFPVAVGDTQEVPIPRADGELLRVALHVGQTEWERERAYLVSLRETATLPPADETAPSVKEVAAEPDGYRILVAEDNPLNQRQLVRLLEKLGYQPDVVTTGREAVEACTRTSYAAVLMDVQMPMMGGFEATARIREHNEAEGMHTPIIAVTAHTLTGDRELCLASGMDDYLPKPVKPAELKTTLARWLPQSAVPVLAPLSTPPSKLEMFR